LKGGGQDYNEYMDKQINLKDMNKNAVQSIITNSIDESSQNNLKKIIFEISKNFLSHILRNAHLQMYTSHKTALQMINRLISCFYQHKQALLNIIEYKVNYL